METKKFDDMTEGEQFKYVAWIVAKVILGIFLLILAFGTFTIIGAGERGVVTRLGAVNRVMAEGLNWKVPLVESVQKIDVKTQKEQVKASAASKDLQTVTAEVALNFHPIADKVHLLYQQVGREFEARIIDPAIQEAVKAATAKYTAEELITKRPLVRDDIKVLLVERLQHAFIAVDDVSIVDLNFSVSFNESIEKKVTAEQDALASKNKLQQTEYEAQQTVVKAKAEAESIRIQAQAIQSQGGSDYVQLQAISKWDGKLPAQMIPGSTVPFINLTK